MTGGDAGSGQMPGWPRMAELLEATAAVAGVVAA